MGAQLAYLFGFFVGEIGSRDGLGCAVPFIALSKTL